MISAILKRFAGNHNKRFQRKCQSVVAQINKIEEGLQSLSDEALQAKTAELKQRYQVGLEALKQRLGRDEDTCAEEQALLSELLPEAFAVVKNAARRLCGRSIEYMGTQSVWTMVHFDVQLIGGIAIHEGNIAEMATGEGKTLVSTLPLYLNALTGHNCQLCTVNEYLAQRDAEWMGHLFSFLGLTVGVVKSQQPLELKRTMYGCDITYGTASELGFDYLRDNGMATRSSDQVQREHFYCIVDEIDSILIDEARTPLIISGPAEEDREAPFRKLKPIIASLVQQQTRLCNRLANEARDELEKEKPDLQMAHLKLLQAKLGMPKNKTFMRLMENGQWRRDFEKYDLEMHSDFMKKQMFACKEALYYVIDEKQHQADLTELGRKTLQPDDLDAFVMPDLPSIFMEIDQDTSLSDQQKLQAKQKEEQLFAQSAEQIHTISQLLRAYGLYERDKEYVVHEGKVAIIDENTGRMMAGRRWSDGLHQAVEAKEGVSIEKESKTYATITIQNYFRLYEKLAGMTGTAETEAGEFHDIYRLDVKVIPTNKPCIRIDEDDVIYKTRREKYKKVIDDIAEAHKKGQPVLVGTASVEASEVVSRMLKRRKLVHSVLNAKYHQQEATIVARAGQKGAITIATNMAGRGTDIKLGEDVAALGGLLVLGTERHNSRRVDRQLRGRCSRQGDPGRSKFYISLEDDLMRLFANTGPIARILQSSFKEDEELTHPLLNRSLGGAQKKVEQQDFSIRKRLLQYDDVLNRQREVVYGLRNQAIHSEEPKEVIFEMIEEELEERLDAIAPKGQKPDAENLQNLVSWANSHFPVSIRHEAMAEKAHEALGEAFLERIHEAYAQKEAVEDPNSIKNLERFIVIRPIDRNWQNHLTEMEDLRRAVGLRGYGQKDPLVEYKTEAFTYFFEMVGRVRGDVCRGLFRSATNMDAFKSMLSGLQKHAKTMGPNEGAVARQVAAIDRNAKNRPQRLSRGFTQPDSLEASQSLSSSEEKRAQVRRDQPKVGRNALVTIRKGTEHKQLKFKKAALLIEREGWQLEKVEQE